MEGAEENREKINLSLRLNRPSRDLLHGLTNQTHVPNGSVQNNGEEQDVEELQLSLGLSMNGRFGVDPDNKKLRRSASISNLVFSAGSVNNGNKHQARGLAFESHAPLGRTCSLPVQSEEEFRRRKEEQSARRLEARKKRMEKKNARLVKDKDNSSEEGSNENGSLVESLVQSNESGVVNNGYENWNVLPSSQGPIGSQRSGSSGLSDLQSQRIAGAAQNGEMKTPSSLRSVEVQGKQESHININGKRTNEVVKSTLFDMPYVSATADGKRIEGFLYKYKKGEEVKIVCVCHGLFLSPAEFIKHGGGGDVEHPLKHIVVNTAPMF